MTPPEKTPGKPSGFIVRGAHRAVVELTKSLLREVTPSKFDYYVERDYRLTDVYDVVPYIREMMDKHRNLASRFVRPLVDLLKSDREIVEKILRDARPDLLEYAVVNGHADYLKRQFAIIIRRVLMELVPQMAGSEKYAGLLERVAEKTLVRWVVALGIDIMPREAPDYDPKSTPLRHHCDPAIRATVRFIEMYELERPDRDFMLAVIGRIRDIGYERALTSEVFGKVENITGR